MLANRLERIQPSATLAFASEAARLKKEGYDVISLALGEPDGRPPHWIIETAQNALQEDVCHKYTPVQGLFSLREAIAEQATKQYGINYDPQKEIIVGGGAKHVIYNALMASINHGDEVIIPAPYWVSYPEMVQLAGGKPVYISAHLKPQELEAAITPQTKWLILNSPANPTGVTLTVEELKAILPVLEKHSHVHVLCDDIYQELIYDSQIFASLLSIAPPDWKDRFLIVSGVSKSFAMTGWRIGYGCGPQHLIQAMILIQSQSSSNTSTIGQIAAEAAIRGPKDFLIEWREKYQKRRDLCRRALEEMGMDCPGGQGAFYLFASCQPWMGKKTPQGKTLQTDQDVAQYLLQDRHVVVIPGTPFGGPGFIRISYATSSVILERGLKRIKEALDACR